MEKTKLTKAIRFKLQIDSDNSRIKEDANSLKSPDFNLSNFIIVLDDFIEQLDLFLYSFLYRGNYEMNQKLIVKSAWMKVYAKSEYAKYSSDKKKGIRQQHTISEYGVGKIIDKSFCEVDSVYGQLCDDASAELNERSKRARTGLLLKRLKARYALPCLMDLVDNVVDKKEKSGESIRLKSLARELKTLLNQGLQTYLPEQSNGMVIAKASFNYYTLNKNPVDYNKELERINKELVTKVDEWKIIVNRRKDEKRDRFESNKIWETIKDDITKRCGDKVLCLGDSPFDDGREYASLRQILKNILATQKADFSMMMQSGVSYNELRSSDLYLFNDISKEDFDDYQSLTDEIGEIATEINQTNNDTKQKILRTELTNRKRQRGALINDADKETKGRFKIYKDFANLYKDVARKHGKLSAQLRSIEKESVESQLLQYWALIAEEDGQHKLILIPKESAKDCHNYLDINKTQRGETNIYWFESFTYRSLQKLCFGNLESGSNSFNKDIQNEIGYQKFKDADGNLKYYREVLLKGEHVFKGSDKEKIKFYKTVLSSRYASQNLNLPVKELKESIINVDFKTLEEFKIALEKICYRRLACGSSNVVEYIKNQYNAQVFGITSLDLQHFDNSKGKQVSYEHKDKMPTVVWKNFWAVENSESCFDIRLNPELSIVYRKPKESRISKYGQGSDLYDPNKKNRYLYEQFTLVATISENCNSRTVNQSFTDISDTKREIESFNEKFNRQNIKFAFGIDNGEVELSTLGVYLPEFNRPTIGEKLEELKKVEKYGFNVLTIKDLNYSEVDVSGKERRLIQNPSYFLKEDLYCRTFGQSSERYNAMFDRVFERKQLLSIDLSTAKVISGYIITNGDVVSLFNLWMRHAQRNIYELNEHAAKAGAKRIILKRSEDLDAQERRKFIDHLNRSNDKYCKLTESEKEQYVAWIYDKWNSNDNNNEDLKKVYKQQRIKGNYLYNVLMAVSFVGDELADVINIFDIRNVFKLREDFYCVMSEKEIISQINAYNKRTISNEELDLKLNQYKSALVANVVGVIDFLYNQYKVRFGGEGYIALEDFDDSKVVSDRVKFSGNIYRVLERKLYAKFQNYGLTPTIKNLIQIRDEAKLKQIGLVRFVDPSGTSQTCPVCENKGLMHTEICSNQCGFDSTGIMHSNDGIAGFNIAKKTFKL